MVTSSVFWDTNLFIYLIERRPENLHKRVVQAREAMVARADQLVTSTLTIGEILVHPLREGKSDLANQYVGLIETGAAVVSMDRAVAWKYAEVRAQYPAVRPPDAVQLACASNYGVALFVTNDRRLSGLKVTGIGQISSLNDIGV